MAWKEIHQRLLGNLHGEVRSRWGRIAETEASLGLSEGYLNKLFSGRGEFRLDTFLKTVELLDLEPRGFFARSLEICPRPDDFLAQLEMASDSDPALSKVVQATMELEAAEPPPASKVAITDADDVKDLAEQAGREQDRRLRQTLKYRTHAFTRAYLEHLDSLRYDNAPDAAKRVTIVATRLIPSLPGPQQERLALQCKALGIFGSARRQKGEFTGAAKAFRLAMDLSRRSRLREDTANLLLRASYLLRDFGHFERALILLNEALAIFIQLGSPWGMGRALVDHGMMSTAVGEYEDAIRDLDQALGYLKGSSASLRRYHLAAYQFLAYAHEQLGNLESAEDCLAKGAEQFGPQHAVDVAKLRWSQGTVAYQRGNYRKSERLLRTAREVLASHENTLQEAVITLDLLAALLAQDKSQEAAQLAGGMAQLVTKFRNNRLAEAAIVELIRGSIEGKLSQKIVSAIRAKLEPRRTIGLPS